MLASRFHPSSYETTADASALDGHAEPPATMDMVDSNHLLHGQREILIRHGSEVYRLRHTRNDKLILTK